MSLFPYFNDPFPSQRQKINDQLNQLESSIRTDKDINLVIIALSALAHHRNLPQKLPAELIEKIKPLEALYNESTLQFSDDMKNRFKKVFEKQLQTTIEKLKDYSLPQKIELMKQPLTKKSATANGTCIDHLPLHEQQQFLRTMHSLHLPELADPLETKEMTSYDRSRLIEALMQGAQQLEETGISLQDLIQWTKSLLTEDMNGDELPSLIQDHVKEVLIESAQELEGTGISLENLIQQTNSLIEQNMSSSDRSSLLHALATAAKRLKGTGVSLKDLVRNTNHLLSDHRDSIALDDLLSLITALGDLAKTFEGTDRAALSDEILEHAKNLLSKNKSSPGQWIHSLITAAGTLRQTGVSLRRLIDYAKPFNSSSEMDGPFLVALATGVKNLTQTNTQVAPFMQELESCLREDIDLDRLIILIKTTKGLIGKTSSLKHFLRSANRLVPPNMPASNLPALTKSFAQASKTLSKADISIDAFMEGLESCIREERNESDLAPLIEALAVAARELKKSKISFEKFMEHVNHWIPPNRAASKRPDFILSFAQAINSLSKAGIPVHGFLQELEDCFQEDMDLHVRTSLVEAAQELVGTNISLKRLLGHVQRLIPSNMPASNLPSCIQPVAHTIQILSAAKIPIDGFLEELEGCIREDMDLHVRISCVEAAQELIGTSISLKTLLRSVDLVAPQSLSPSHRAKFIKSFARTIKTLSTTDVSLDEFLEYARNLKVDKSSTLFKNTHLLSSLLENLKKTKVPLRTALDAMGLMIKHTGCYHGPLTEALLQAKQELEREGISLEDLVTYASTLITKEMGPSDLSHFATLLTQAVKEVKKTDDSPLQKPFKDLLMEKLVQKAFLRLSKRLDQTLLNLMFRSAHQISSSSERDHFLQSFIETSLSNPLPAHAWDCIEKLASLIGDPTFKENILKHIQIAKWIENENSANLLKNLQNEPEANCRFAIQLAFKKHHRLKGILLQEQLFAKSSPSFSPGNPSEFPLKNFPPPLQQELRKILSPMRPPSLFLAIDQLYQKDPALSSKIRQAVYQGAINMDDPMALHDYTQLFFHLGWPLPEHLLSSIQDVADPSMQQSFVQTIAKKDPDFLPQGPEESRLYFSILEEIVKGSSLSDGPIDAIERRFQTAVLHEFEAVESSDERRKAFFQKYANDPLCLSIAYSKLHSQGMALNDAERQIVLQSKDLFLKIRKQLKDLGPAFNREMSQITASDRTKIFSNRLMQRFKQNWKELTMASNVNEAYRDIYLRYTSHALPHGDFSEIEYKDLIGEVATLWMPGISLLASYVSQKKQIETLLVCATAQSLRSEIVQMKTSPEGQKKVFLIGSEASHPLSENPDHKIAVCVEKKDGILHVLLLDSMGEKDWTSTVIDQLQFVLDDCQLYTIAFDRQNSNRGCLVFTFQDALAFLEDPHFLEKIEYRDHRTERWITQLPPRCMIPTQSMTQINAYQEQHPAAFLEKKGHKTLEEVIQQNTIEESGKAQNRYTTKKFLKYQHLIAAFLETLPTAQIQAMVDQSLIA